MLQWCTKALESQAVFKERLDALGLDGKWQEFQDLGWSTYWTFAYASSYMPGNFDDSKLLQEVVLKFYGDVEHVKKDALGRLYFESYTVATAELRRRRERTEDDAP